MKMKFKTVTELQRNKVLAARNDLVNAGYHIDFCNVADGVVWDTREDDNIIFKDNTPSNCADVCSPRMSLEEQLDMEEVITEKLSNYDRMKSLGITVS